MYTWNNDKTNTQVLITKVKKQNTTTTLGPHASNSCPFASSSLPQRGKHHLEFHALIPLVFFIYTQYIA